MGLQSILILLVIAVVAFTFVGTEISAFINDTVSLFDQRIRDIDIRIPNPETGTQVCDLLITVNIRSISAISGTTFITTERILFSDGQEGKLITWLWDNCHTKGFISANLAPFDFLSRSLPKLEFFIPSAGIGDTDIIISYVLVDEKGLEKKLPQYQDVRYIHPSFIERFDFQEKVRYREIASATYVLDIIPFEAHFDNKKTGEALSKTITFP